MITSIINICLLNLHIWCNLHTALQEVDTTVNLRPQFLVIKGIESRRESCILGVFHTYMVLKFAAAITILQLNCLVRRVASRGIPSASDEGF